MSEGWTEQDQQRFELEQVGLLWERIHNPYNRLYEIKENTFDEDEVHVVFKFKKVKE